eukprot:jgi/Tetstr1/445100/TSEL_003382.t1
MADSAQEKAELSAVFDKCWPRDTQTDGDPFPLKKTARFPIAASRYTERIGYAGLAAKRLGKYYPAGKSSPYNVMFKGEEEVCEVTQHSEAAAQDPEEISCEEGLLVSSGGASSARR